MSRNLSSLALAIRDAAAEGRPLPEGANVAAGLELMVSPLRRALLQELVTTVEIDRHAAQAWHDREGPVDEAEALVRGAWLRVELDRLDACACGEIRALQAASDAEIERRYRRLFR